MAKIAYIDGHYKPLSEAHVNVEDRSYQFSDGVYEVFALRDGLLVDEEAHLDRLERSLAEMSIPAVMTRQALKLVIRETIRKNSVSNGVVYLQISRGVAPRNHVYPDDLRPVLVITVRPQILGAGERLRRDGIAVVSQPDQRWARCDIKTVSLLPNILARQSANTMQAQEAWLLDEDGFITEGAATNAWIVNADGVLLTRPSGPDILAGITREILLEVIKSQNMDYIERAFTLEEAFSAREAFSTASTLTVFPVVSIDSHEIGTGRPGPLTLQLFDAYEKYSIKS
ncbi:MAG: D-amino-acid transaminase [Parvibaculales bacterium]